MRIVVAGGGFGGVITVRHLERLLRRHSDVEITLVSRDNFFTRVELRVEREQVKQARELVEKSSTKR